MSTAPVRKFAAVKMVSRRGPEVAKAIALRRLDRVLRRDGVTLITTPRSVRTVDNILTGEQIVVATVRGASLPELAP